jgi:hypothetical protein
MALTELALLWVPFLLSSLDCRNSLTISEIIQTARKRPKVFAPNDRSTYSNVAFSLLGMVLERATNKSYFDAISSSILQPLGMNHTRVTKPKDSEGVIPVGLNDWAQDIGADNPSGGIYCTANDLSKYLRSILSSTLLPQATINAWMKPHSWTSGTHAAYGMPWEILRTTKLTPDRRGIDIITKGGALTQYYATIIAVPEYGLGFTFLIAGDSPALVDLREKFIATLIPAVELLVREEARNVYAGTWVSGKDESDMNWSLSIEVDDIGPGLRVVDWLSNGTAFLPVYGEIKYMPSDAKKWQARLIPSGIYNDSEGLGSEIWRLTAIPDHEEEDKSKVFDDECFTEMDSVMYDGYSIEEFEIGRDEGGKGIWMNIRGMRTLLWRMGEEEGRYRVVDEGFRNGQLPMVFDQII